MTEIHIWYDSKAYNAFYNRSKVHYETPIHTMYVSDKQLVATLDTQPKRNMPSRLDTTAQITIIPHRYPKDHLSLAHFKPLKNASCIINKNIIGFNRNMLRSYQLIMACHKFHIIATHDIKRNKPLMLDSHAYYDPALDHINLFLASQALPKPTTK